MTDTFWGNRVPGSCVVEPAREDQEPEMTMVLLSRFIDSDWFAVDAHPKLPAHCRIRVTHRGMAPCLACETMAPHLQGSGVGVIDCPRCKTFVIYPVFQSGVALPGVGK